MTEWVLAFMRNLSFVAGWVCFVCSVGLIVTTITVLFLRVEISSLKRKGKSYEAELAEAESNLWLFKRTRSGLAAFVISSSIVLAIPSPDQLWEVRIALIKLQLSSPENVKAGAETITRIAKELEVKYLTNGAKK